MSEIRDGDFVRFNTTPLLRENPWRRVRGGMSLEGVEEHIEAPRIVFPSGDHVAADRMWRDPNKLYANARGASLYKDNKDKGHWYVSDYRSEWPVAYMANCERVWPPTEVEP